MSIPDELLNTKELPVIKLDENTTQKDVSGWIVELWGAADSCNEDKKKIRELQDRFMK